MKRCDVHNIEGNKNEEQRGGDGVEREKGREEIGGEGN